jgi:Cu+-exporting ATPase
VHSALAVGNKRVHAWPRSSEKVDTLVVDKTGTRTEGTPRLISVVPAEGFSEMDLLLLASSLERGSEHPLAAAIVAGAPSP